MYNKNEMPLIRATVFYYDTAYTIETAEKLLLALSNNGFDYPTNMFAEKLTNNRFIKLNKNCTFRELFVKGCTHKDITDIVITSKYNEEDYWKIEFGFTFLKNTSNPVIHPTFNPWNRINIDATYSLMHSEVFSNQYYNLFNEIISIVKPIFGSIDDVDKKVSMLKRNGFTHFVPNTIQAIYWCNYYGHDICNSVGIDKLLSLPITNKKQTNDGFIYYLTENVLDFSSLECMRKRSIVERILMHNTLYCKRD